jgi:hypothetical protein
LTCPVRIEKVTNGYVVAVQDSFSSGNKNDSVFTEFGDLVDWLFQHFDEPLVPKLKEGSP